MTRSPRRQATHELLCLHFGLLIACDTVHDNVATAVSDAAEPNGAILANVGFSYWPFIREADFTGPADTVLNDPTCSPVATVSSGFAQGLCVSGSGKLLDGSVINFESTCSCGYYCEWAGTTVCFTLVNPAQFPWGVGSKDSPIVPLRSLTVDETQFEHGLVLYTPSWDGLVIPSLGGLDGFVHDGCFRADDAGYGITGSRVALAAGPNAMFSWLESNLPSATQSWDVYRNNQHCTYLNQP